MRFFWLALKDLFLIGRDKKALLTLILMPLILISILGASFGNLMNGKDVVIKKFTLGVADLDKGPLSKNLIENVLKKGLSKQIQVKSYHEDDIKTKIRNQELTVGIVIEPDFSALLMSGKQGSVKLLSSPDSGINTKIVQSVIEQFSQSITIEAVSAKVTQEKSNLPNKAAAGITSSSLEDPLSQTNQPLIRESTVDSKTKPVGSFQYYAAAMGVMFLLMTVVQGVSAMILEKEQEVYKRLLLTNLTYTDYLIGKMLGLFIICLLQAFIVVIGTKFLYGVNWGSSVSGVVMTTFAYVFASCGLGVLAGSFMKTEKSFSVAGMFGTQILAALGGSMAPLYIFPHWVVSIIKFLPNGLALQTYLKLMTGTGFNEILPAAAGMFGMGILFLSIGLFRLSIERRGKYA